MTISPAYFQDLWLFLQINARLSRVFCYHLHVFCKIFQKVTHLITMKFFSDRLSKNRCILLVLIIPINSFKSSSIILISSLNFSYFGVIQLKCYIYLLILSKFGDSNFQKLSGWLFHRCIKPHNNIAHIIRCWWNPIKHPMCMQWRLQDKSILITFIPLGYTATFSIHFTATSKSNVNLLSSWSSLSTFRSLSKS